MLISLHLVQVLLAVTGKIIIRILNHIQSFHTFHPYPIPTSTSFDHGKDTQTCVETKLEPNLFKWCFFLCVFCFFPPTSFNKCIHFMSSSKSHYIMLVVVGNNFQHRHVTWNVLWMAVIDVMFDVIKATWHCTCISANWGASASNWHLLKSVKNKQLNYHIFISNE